jgi:anti-sigma B factor antagonist
VYSFTSTISGAAMIEVHGMSDEPFPADSQLRARRTPYRDDLYVVTVEGEVDMGTAPQLAKALDGEIPPVLVADLTGVTFLSAAGLRVLVDAAERAHSQRRCLGLVARGPLALRVLRTSGVAGSIPTFESLSDAVRELAPRPASVDDQDS